MTVSNKLSGLPIMLSTLFMTGCASPQTDPSKLDLTQSTENAVVAVKLVGKHVNYFGVQSISIIKYSENRAKTRPNRPPVATWIPVHLNYKSNSDGYSVAEIPAGTYFLAYGTIPKKWGGCFNKDTVRFEVASNKVVYLGEINLDAFIVEVETASITYKGNKLGAINYFNSQYDNTKNRIPSHFKNDLNYSPSFKNTDPQSLKNVSNFLIKSGAKIGESVEAAKFERMSFPKRKSSCAHRTPYNHKPEKTN